MKLCIITNHLNNNYINDSLIHDRLITTLGLTPKDVFNPSDPNSAYQVNKEYTHALILLDYRASSLHIQKTYLSEIKIPRVFIVDSVPQVHKDLDIFFSNNILQITNSHLSILPKAQQFFLYNEYADALIFYNQGDIKVFDSFYPLTRPIPITVIPPSLGNKDDIQVNFNTFLPNKNIGFNGSPSFGNGLFNASTTLSHIPTYSLNIYGNHGRADIPNEILMNYMTDLNSNVKHWGILKNQLKFFQENHIYYGASQYDSFNYFTFTSILNGMVPLLSSQSKSSEFFPDYPFIVDINSEKQIPNMVLKISNTPDYQLKDILNTAVNKLKHLNYQNSQEQYYNFLNSL